MLVQTLVLQALEPDTGKEQEATVQTYDVGMTMCGFCFPLKRVQRRNTLGLHGKGLKTNVAVLFQGPARHRWLCDTKFDSGEFP